MQLFSGAKKQPPDFNVKGLSLFYATFSTARIIRGHYAIESAIGFSSVRSSHEAVECFLQRVALRQLIGEAQHDVKGIPVLVGQSVAMCKKQPAGAFEIAALIGGQLLLHTFANVVHGLRAEAHDVEAVNDDLRIQ